MSRGLYHSSGETARNPQSELLKIVGSVVSQAAVLSALLYYFGWARARAVFDYFGLDSATVGYTTADYVLNSVPATFEPIVIALVLVALVPTFHRYFVIPLIQRKTSSRRIGSRLLMAVQSAAYLSYAFIVISIILQLSIGSFLGMGLPSLLVVVSLLLVYVDYYQKKQISTRDKMAYTLMRVRAISLYSLSFVGVFWAFGLYASQAGKQAAIEFSRDLLYQPQVALYSAQRLALNGPGISVEPISQPDSKYRYRYTGLIILAQPPGKYLLIAVGWRKGQGSVFFVPDDTTIRLDVGS
jgi:uncharacterized membrane protein